MKKILLYLSFLLVNITCLNAQLAAGDIAFVGYNTDAGPNASQDHSFSFITLTNIPGNEEIFFTEEGWDDINLTWAGTTEGHLRWTAPAAGVPCGTVIFITESGVDVFTIVGGGVVVLESGSGWNLSAGDQVLAYQAATAEPATTPTFIAAINGDDGNGSPVSFNPLTSWNDPSSGPLGTAKSGLPTGLSNGVNCVSLFVTTFTEEDNAKYTGSLTGTSTVLRAAINNRTNWSTNDNTAFNISPAAYSPSVTCVAPCIDPSIPTLTTSPSSICPGSSTALNIVGSLNDATAWHVYTGSCGGTAVGTTTTGSFSTANLAGNTTFFVRGEGGCVTPGSCSTITVNVSDVIPPSITCPGNQTETPNASCQFVLPDYTGLVTSSDNCAASPSLSQSPVPGTTISGNTTITMTADDGNGNTAQCTFDVILNDNVAPSAVCQNINAYLDAAGNISIAAADIDGGSSDNCSGVSFSISASAFTCADIGPNTVTLTVTDGNSNSASCNAIVTVIDSLSPNAVCQNINAYLDGTGSVSILAADVDGASSDNCTGVSFSISNSIFSCADIGLNNVSLTVTDGNANSTSCVASVTVLDTISPNISCPGNQTETPNTSCQFVLPDYTGLVTSSDNCAASPSLSQSPVPGTTISGNTTITMTANDGNGNTSQCTFDVILNDNVPPTAVCQNINAYLDAAGNVSIVAADIDGGSSDNCSGVSFSISASAFTCADIGPNTVTLTVTDGNSNSASCPATVTVLDTITSVNNCSGTLIWNGNTSSDWGTASNWNLNLVPTSSDDVLIVDVTAGSGNNPVINTSLIVGELTIDAGGQLSINSGGVLIIGAGNTVTNNGTLILNADASGAGILDDFTNPGASYFGNIVARQFITSGSGLGQRLIASPVLNGVVQGLDPTYTTYPLGQLLVDDCATDLLQVGSPYSNLLQWNEHTVTTCDLEGWEALPSNAVFQNGRGYSGWVNDGSTIEFSGIPNSGNLSYAGLGNSGSGVANAAGWHLLGNPYPSPISRNALATLNGPNFTSYIYYEGNSGPFSGTYQPFLPTENLAMAQGFSAQSASTNTFVFDNSVRVNSNVPFKSGNDWFDAKLDITVSGNNFADKTYLFYNEYASTNFDYLWDCVKRESEQHQPTLYTGLSSDKLALNGRNILSLGEPVPMGLNSGETGEFVLNFAGLETFPSDIMIYLEDKAENSFHDLSEGAYQFISNSIAYENRFVIHFQKNDQTTGMGNALEPTIDVDIYPNPSEGAFTVSSNEQHIQMLEMYNVLGELILKSSPNKKTINIDLSNEARGVYFINIQTEKGHIVQKIVLE